MFYNLDLKGIKPFRYTIIVCVFYQVIHAVTSLVVAGVASLAVAGVASLVDAGVVSLAVAGVVSLAHFAEVVPSAVGVTYLADPVGVVTEEMTVRDGRGALDGSVCDCGDCCDGSMDYGNGEDPGG